MKTLEEIYEDYGLNQNHLIVISATYETNLNRLFSDAASQYGTPNPPTAPYVLGPDGGNDILSAIGGYPYTPHMKLVSPLGVVDSISWYDPPSNGYSYDKLVSIFNENEISQDPTPVDGHNSTVTTASKPFNIVKITPYMFRLQVQAADKYGITVQSVNGQIVKRLIVQLTSGSNSISWDRLNPGMYIITVEGSGNKTHTKSFILK